MSFGHSQVVDRDEIFAVTIWDRTADGQYLSFDLADILSVCGERTRTSNWLCIDVEAEGSASEELHAISDRKEPIPGDKLARIANNIDQIIDGSFEAKTTVSESPWLFIRAVDGVEFAVVTSEQAVIDSIRRRFADVRESPLDRDYLLSRGN